MASGGGADLTAIEFILTVMKLNWFEENNQAARIPSNCKRWQVTIRDSAFKGNEYEYETE